MLFLDHNTIYYRPLNQNIFKHANYEIFCLKMSNRAFRVLLKILKKAGRMKVDGHILFSQNDTQLSEWCSTYSFVRWTAHLKTGHEIKGSVAFLSNSTRFSSGYLGASG